MLLFVQLVNPNWKYPLAILLGAIVLTSLVNNWPFVPVTTVALVAVEALPVNAPVNVPVIVLFVNVSVPVNVT